MDPMRIAEYLLTAALVFVALALICQMLLLTAKKRRAAPAKKKVLVAAGAGELEDELAVDVAGPEAELDSDNIELASETVAAEGETAPAVLAEPKGNGVSLTRWALIFAVIAFALLTGYLGVRMAISGHGPFSNQHEFAVAFTWGIMLAFLIAEWRFRIRIIAVVVLPVAACLLIYAMNLDTTVAPLVPALQNSVLLTLHVGFAILSYGAACVSCGAAVLYLLRPRMTVLRRISEDRLDEIGYKGAVVAFPLMTIMIVLGALWADTAWGRYWGWDPKETAALVTWLVYGAFLHARVVRGWRGKKAAWLLIVGFAAVLFAYFGNHFFGGLHSYG
ncbi:MAG: c-type cytochrome biogenesis protein CcsB [Propionibacteriaceae bacterium]|jgi:cytochrome c-type biogenesis protein CcsB|nr:c-type cytochrome biogenesis protein CcsB [Propionibacteriaceae bacterium]